MRQVPDRDDSGAPGRTRVGRAPSEPTIERNPESLRAPVAFAETATPNLAGANDDLTTLPPVSPDLYTVGFQLAQGGMGKIYAARDRMKAEGVTS